MDAKEFRAILAQSQQKGISIAETIKARESAKKPRKKPSQPEHNLQVQCIEWFRASYPKHLLDLFAIGNGGKRDAVTGAFMKREGVIAGVADLCFAVPRLGYGCLFIEMKTPKGKQSEHQIAFERSTTRAGNLYKVCRSLSEFKVIIKDYLQENKGLF